MRPARRAPIVTAGLTWHPDTGPIRYTSDSSVRPNASAVATTPAATLAPANLKPNIRVATPQATYTRIAVPRNSTASFRIIRLVLLVVRHGAMTGRRPDTSQTDPSIPAAPAPHPRKVTCAVIGLAGPCRYGFGFPTRNELTWAAKRVQSWNRNACPASG